ncbi:MULTISPECIES: hypothetical protein [Rhizobium]|uniref:Holin n=1 Tax=Rhizobium metallidurans TaxID=1265931 RepID=A0A7W6CRR0_9HYPH|nr:MULTISPECIES: hypothetical protein [Rhizobium]MBB3963742.1 hypothetical protein [Rhizobium metallidurans]
MPELKNWYSSKTIWGAVVAMIASALHFTGVDIATADRGEIVDAIVNIAGALGGLLAVYGRVTATSVIKPKT